MILKILVNSQAKFKQGSGINLYIKNDNMTYTVFLQKIRTPLLRMNVNLRLFRLVWTCFRKKKLVILGNCTNFTYQNRHKKLSLIWFKNIRMHKCKRYSELLLILHFTYINRQLLGWYCGNSGHEVVCAERPQNYWPLTWR